MAGRLHFPPWMVLLLTCRAIGAATAIALLSAHRVTDHDATLVAITAGYVGLTSLVIARWPRTSAAPVFWVVDVAVLHGLLWFSGDWRSPFYLLVLTSLALPAAWAGARRGFLVGLGYVVLFVITAREIGPDPVHLGTQASLETLATHIVLPIVVCFGIGYAAETLRKLARERERAELLAIETERRRIAFELHDSAKQRVHAAHLVLSSLVGRGDETSQTVVGQAIGELRAASADMDTSLAELRSPLEGRPLEVALRDRAEQLTVPGGPRIEVRGAVAGLSPLAAAHAYRIVSEAMTNAARHARAEEIVVSLSRENGAARVAVVDDGRGMPDTTRPGSSGLLSMHNRARTLGGDLELEPGPSGRGTRVAVTFPIDPPQGGHQ